MIEVCWGWSGGQDDLSVDTEDEIEGLQMVEEFCIAQFPHYTAGMTEGFADERQYIHVNELSAPEVKKVWNFIDQHPDLENTDA